MHAGPDFLGARVAVISDRFNRKLLEAEVSEVSMTARTDDFDFEGNLDEIIDRVADRLSRRFVWQLRLQRCTQATLVVAAGFAVIVASDILTLLALGCPQRS